MRRVEAISNLNTVCTSRSKSAFHSAEKRDLSVVNLVLSANSTASSSEAITAEEKEMLITHHSHARSNDGVET